MTSFSFFWLARNNDGGACDYVISVYPLERRTWQGSTGEEFVEWETGRGDDVRVCMAFWHLAGGLLLPPGGGPKRVRIKLAVNEVPAATIAADVSR